MTLPQAPDLGATSEPSGEPPAVSHFGQPVSVAPVSVAPVAVTAVSGAPVPGGLETLRHRPDFLKAAAARRQGTASFLLQARARDDGQASARIGFTASKKIGNAVARNRA